MILTVTTPAEFTNWLKAGPDTCVYHTGNLAWAAGNLTASGRAARDIRAAAWTAAIDREVYLIQRKFGNEPAQYLAVKPEGGKVPERFAPGTAMTQIFDTVKKDTP